MIETLVAGCFLRVPSAGGVLEQPAFGATKRQSENRRPTPARADDATTTPRQAGAQTERSTTPTASGAMFLRATPWEALPKAGTEVPGVEIPARQFRREKQRTFRQAHGHRALLLVRRDPQ